MYECTPSPEQRKKMEFWKHQVGHKWAICQPLNNSRRTHWHIRHLGQRGLAVLETPDTDTLCGRKAAWDIDINTADQVAKHNERLCRTCVKLYQMHTERLAHERAMFDDQGELTRSEVRRRIEQIKEELARERRSKRNES